MSLLSQPLSHDYTMVIGLPAQPSSQDFTMDDAASVQDSVIASNMSTTESGDASNPDSYVSGHPGWLDDYPLHLEREIDLMRPLWENFQAMHDDLDRLGCQILLGHEERDLLVEGHVRMEKELSRELKEARTQTWSFKVEMEGMRHKIFQLEATLDNVQEDSINCFRLEAHIDDLREKLHKMITINNAFKLRNNNLLKSNAGLQKGIRELENELRLEQDLKTDFQAKYNEQVAGKGNVERWLADYKIRKMKAAVDAAKAETAHWKRVSADVINGYRPTGLFSVFSTNQKLTRRQSF